MKQEAVQLLNKGMRQDESISKSSVEYAFLNTNIRLVQSEDNTYYAITNEQCPYTVPLWKQEAAKLRKGFKIVFVKVTYGADTDWYCRIIDPDTGDLLDLDDYESTVLKNVSIEMYLDPEASTELVKTMDIGDITISGTETNIYTTVTVDPHDHLTPWYTKVVIPSTTFIELQYVGEDDQWSTYQELFIYYDEAIRKIHTEKYLPTPTEHATIKGEFLGINESSKYCTLFTGELVEDNWINHIYRLEATDHLGSGVNIDVLELYAGDLNITTPVETLFYYENEDIQKVYWVDGINSPRFINIANTDTYIGQPSTIFDFSPVISTPPTVTITKEYSYSGLFAQGVIQYFVSYYNKFFAETKLVYASSLQYLSFKDRGAKEDENVYCGFKIDLRDLDTNFEYARIYSVQRTSQDGPVIAKIVTDIKIEDDGTATVVDLGTTGETIDPNLLYYIGGQDFVAGTLDSKDDVLFLGDITLKNTVADFSVEQTLRDRIRYVNDTSELHQEDIRQCLDLYWGYKSIPTPTPQGYYAYEQEINKSEKEIAGFKRGEIYRFAVQFMTSTGTWTSPVWIGDSECTLAPIYDEDLKSYKVPVPKWDLTLSPSDTSGITTAINEAGYIASRLLYAHTDYTTRKILAQGVVNPTLFNYYERSYNEPYSIASWNFRPRGGELAWQHYQNIGHQYSEYSELQGVTKTKLPFFSIERGKVRDMMNNYMLFLGLDPGHEMMATLVYYSFPENNNDSTMQGLIEDIILGEDNLKNYEDGSIDWTTNGYYIAKQYYVNTTSWSNTRSQMITKLKQGHNDIMDILYGGYASDYYNQCPNFDVIIPTTKVCKNVMKWLSSHVIWGAVASLLLPPILSQYSLAQCITNYGNVLKGSASALAQLTSPVQIDYITLNNITWYQAISPTVMLQAYLASENISDAEKQMGSLGWLNARDYDTVDEALGKMFDNLDLPSGRKESFRGGSFWMCGGNISYGNISQIDEDAANKLNQYYVDNSIVSINSPELSETQDVLNNNSSVGCNIVGLVPIQALYTDYNIEASTPFLTSSKVLKGLSNSSNIELTNPVLSELVSGNFYQDHWFIKPVGGVPSYEEDSYTINGNNGVTGYKTFLWNRPFLSVAGAYAGITVANDQGETQGGFLEHKVFANQLFSFNTEYLNVSSFWDSGCSTVKVYFDDKNLLTLNSQGSNIKFISGNYDALVAGKEAYEILTADNVQEDYDDVTGETTYSVDDPYGLNKFKVTDAVRIKYESTPFALIELGNDIFGGVSTILPKLTNETSIDLSVFYPSKVNVVEEYMTDGTVTYTNPWSMSGSIATESGIKVWLDYDNDILSIDLTNVSSTGVDIQARTITEGDVTVTSYVADFGDGTTAMQYILTAIKDWLHTNSWYEPNDLNNVYEFLVYGDTTQPDYDAGDPSTWKGMLTDTTIAVELILPTVIIGGEPAPISGPHLWYMVLGAITKTAGHQEIKFVYNIDDTTVYQYQDAYLRRASKEDTNKYNLWYVLGEIRRANGQIFLVTENDGVKVYPVIGTGGVKEDTISAYSDYPYLYMAELYKKNFQYSTLYGGYSDYAIQRIQWVPCSEPCYDNTIIDKTWGDTFYQRWDCLKSYPSTEEDQNSIVEILSFMVESHINLDGRCDVNRGLSNIINARPTNWNLINKVYSQENNLFQYAVLDDKFKTNRFSNEIVWSLNKKSASDIDTWSNITLLSSLFLDGQYGPVNKILNNNGTLITFQDKAIGVINFNNRTQISTEQGVPIEVANSGKVNGYTYLDTTSGTTNKWTVCKTRNGIYYMDNYNRQLRLFNGEGSRDLGLEKGMSNYFKLNITLDSYYDYITYDISTGDVLIYNANDWLYSFNTVAFNEYFNSFTSFYPCYSGLLFPNLSGYQIALNTGVDERSYPVFIGGSYPIEIYYPRKGYTTVGNYDYPLYYNYILAYKVNPEPLVDKIFSTIEYIGDVYSQNIYDNILINNTILNEAPINTIQVWDDYQNTGACNVTEDPLSSDVGKRKFRIRRFQIPRDIKDTTAYGMNRIRNPWCIIGMTYDTEILDNPQTEEDEHKLPFDITKTMNKRIELHSIVVKYFK